MCEKANFIVEGLKLDLYVSYLYSKKVIIKNIKKFGGTKIEKKKFGGVTLNLFFFSKCKKNIRGCQNGNKKKFGGVTLNKTFFF
jgi:hypothetical protein